MAINNQNDGNFDDTPAAPVSAAAAGLGRLQSSLQNSARASTPAAQAVKKAVSKPVASLSAEFTNVRGQTPTPTMPSLAQPLIFRKPVDDEWRAKEKLFGDISVIRLNASDEEASGITAAKNDLRDQAESARSYSYEGSSDYSGDYATQNYWEQAVADNNNYMYRLQEDIRDNDSQQQEWRTRIEEETRQIETLDDERTDLLERRDELTEQIRQGQKDLAEAEELSRQAGERLDAKLKEVYPPDGNEPAYGEPNPVADAEAKLHDKAYDQHRQEILDFYKSKGLEQEFLTMERSGKGEKVAPEEVSAALKKIQAANVPYDPNIKLVEILRRDDPQNPYLDTVHVARLDVGNTWQKQVTAQAYQELQLKAATKEIGDIDARLSANDQEMKSLQEQKGNHEKELKKLQDKREELTQKLDQAKKYDEWLNSPETKQKLAAGQLTLEDFKAQTPKFMADGWIDNKGLECVNPATSRGQALAAEAQSPDTASTATPGGNAADAQATSRTATSAAGSDIAAPDVKESFTAAASGNATPEAAPVPQAPAPQQQKPAVAAAAP